MTTYAAHFGAQVSAVLARFGETAAISRTTNVSDGAGGQTATWANAATGIACQRSPLGGSAQERAIADRMAGITLWSVALPAGTDVLNTDRLVIGSETYEVVGVLAPESLETCRLAVCMKVE